MQRALAHLGVEQQAMVQLVSRSGPTTEPTRANILASMAAVRDRTRPGDRVFFYFSGHGAQQPQPARHGTRPTEADGLDEVLLTADVERWSGPTTLDSPAIPNAILDDEVGEWIDSVVDRGGRVWAFFDTCHAAGMARGEGGRWRSVSAAELGLVFKGRKAETPKARPARAHEAPSLAPMASGRQDGRTLAFAARSHELTSEEWLPRHAPLGQSRMHGVFTFHLAGLLLSGEALEADILRTSLLKRYLNEQRTAPVPAISGRP